MTRHVSTLAVVVVLALGLATPAPAAEMVNFDPAAFAAAQQAGASIVVFVHAPW